MSLTARIAVVPSRRLDRMGDVLAGGGVVVACVTLVARWPGSLGAALAVALGVVIAGIVARHRRDRTAAGFTMFVSDRAEVEIASVARHDADETWRLTDATLVWPGCIVVALQSDSATGAGPTTRVVPLLDRELALPDRRALRRFLTWSLRGGVGRATTSSPVTGPR